MRNDKRCSNIKKLSKLFINIYNEKESFICCVLVLNYSVLPNPEFISSNPFGWEEM